MIEPHASTRADRSRLRSGLIAAALAWAALAGCAAPQRQTTQELLAALDWFVPPSTRSEWPHPSITASVAPRPAVVIAWAPTPRGGGLRPRVPPSVRESWIASLRVRLEEAQIASKVTSSPPDALDNGVTLERIRTLAKDQAADVLIVFSLDHEQRRYNVAQPGDAQPGRGASVVNVVQVLSTARVIGMTAAGMVVFSGSAIGYDEGLWNMEDVADVSNRVALEGAYQTIVKRLREIKSRAAPADSK